MTRIELTPPAAFINSNQRLHHHKRAELTRAWREAAYVKATNECPGHRLIPPVHITCAIRFPNEIRRDIGNWYPTAKACVDGLVDAGIIPDDSDHYLTGPDMRRLRPNGTPLVVITITEDTP